LKNEVNLARLKNEVNLFVHFRHNKKEAKLVNELEALASPCPTIIIPLPCLWEKGKSTER